MDKPGLVDYALAPLTWLERSRGWKRGAILLFYLLIAATAGLLGRRELGLWRLPDIGEPFDVVRHGSVAVPDGDNAMIPYLAAVRALIPADPARYKAASPKSWDHVTWATADPEVRRWATDNRAAYDLWLGATARPDSLLVQPRDFRPWTGLDEVFSLRHLARLALLEASRLAEAGDVAGAWPILNATLRSSRHAGMHGGAAQRSVGHAILMPARVEVRKWIDDPQVGADLLRRAIVDLEATRAMTPPASDMIRAKYFLVRSGLVEDADQMRRSRRGGAPDEGSWSHFLPLVPEVREFLLHEPERSLRVLRLIVAGQLAQCDRPPGTRPPWASQRFGIYALAPTTPKPVAALSPAELESWAERSPFLSQFDLADGRVQAWIDAEVGMFDGLLFAMAERAYELERGTPPKTYADLLGRYLKALPEGFAPGDPLGAASGPN